MACGPLLRLSSSKRCPNLSGYSYKTSERGDSAVSPFLFAKFYPLERVVSTHNYVEILWFQS